jgi:hypothetical protein
MIYPHEAEQVAASNADKPRFCFVVFSRRGWAFCVSLRRNASPSTGWTHTPSLVSGVQSRTSFTQDFSGSSAFAAGVLLGGNTNTFVAQAMVFVFRWSEVGHNSKRLTSGCWQRREVACLVYSESSARRARSLTFAGRIGTALGGDWLT